MGYTLDYFVAPLKCPICGSISPEDNSTNMQTKIRNKPELAFLIVGCPLLIQPEVMEDSGYLTVQLPKTGEAIRILQTWDCPNCGTPLNWAEIVVDNGVIQQIIPVILSRQQLDWAHFISDECESTVAHLINQPIQDVVSGDVNLVQILKERL